MNKKNRSKLCRVASVCSIILAGGWAQAQTPPDSLPEMPAKVEKVSSVVAKIRCKSENSSKDGSGAVVGLTKDGHAVILTACHVVAINFDSVKADRYLPLKFYDDITVQIGADTTVAARVDSARFDLDNDLALIHTREPVLQEKVIRYSRKDAKRGQKVATIGYVGYHHAVLEGPDLTVGRITNTDTTLLVFDAKIEQGNSGGPLVDQDGRMMGMVVLKSEAEGYKPQEEGYAAPMDIVASVTNRWLKKMELKKKWQASPKVKPLYVFSGVGALGIGAAAILLPKSGEPTVSAAIFDFPPPPPPRDQ